ncbi:hypothetical protein RB608_27075 [Nocardioides sp. LHD-245]|uniref:hypothetical protein n=1 Tax=Nocardioides sp. LHD-245 TaxID=3051387 RepID=UPI0027DFEDFE|nr:hypothetical protein [Nocardioides sp. LHD-245]
MSLKASSYRKVVLAGVGAMLMIASLAAGATALVYQGGYTKDSVQIRTGPSSSTTLVARGYKNENVCLFHTVTGESNGGSTTWWWTKNVTRNKSGYSPGSKLYIIGPLSSC